MKRMSLALSGFLFIGCNNVDTSLTAIDIITPEVEEEMGVITGCKFDPGAAGMVGIVFNTDPRASIRQMGDPVVAQRSMTLRARVQNELSDQEIVYEMDPEEKARVPTAITPLRFDFRWECDSSGFTAGLGKFLLPQFSTTQSFCLDERNEAAGGVGFDQVPASGGAIRAQQVGLVSFTPIPTQLGNAFDDFFRLAEEAERCCHSVGGCSNLAMANTTMGPCKDLQDLFDGISAPGTFSARTQQDVDQWRLYSEYTWVNSIAGPGGNVLNKHPTLVGSYPLRLRGRFEGITAAGSEVISTDLITEIKLCRGCTSSTPACTSN